MDHQTEIVCDDKICLEQLIENIMCYRNLLSLKKLSENVLIISMKSEFKSNKM